VSAGWSRVREQLSVMLLELLVIAGSITEKKDGEMLAIQAAVSWPANSSLISK